VGLRPRRGLAAVIILVIVLSHHLLEQKHFIVLMPVPGFFFRYGWTTKMFIPELHDVEPELIGLWVQTLVYGITAWLVYYRSYGKHLKDLVEVAEERLQARWAEYL